MMYNCNNDKSISTHNKGNSYDHRSSSGCRENDWFKIVNNEVCMLSLKYEIIMF